MQIIRSLIVGFVQNTFNNKHILVFAYKNIKIFKEVLYKKLFFE